MHNRILPHQRKRKSLWKQAAIALHRWLGLLTGLVVLVVALTGALYCFAPELGDATQPYRFVQTRRKAMLPPSQLISIAEAQVGKKANRVQYGAEGRSAYVLFFGKERSYYYNVYLNQYDGTVLRVKDMNRDFFAVLLQLHMTLLLPKGKEIIGWCTVIFVLMLITGIVLWWPRNKAARKQRFAVKWGASPKRLNYDLHNVLGFYASWVVIITALTGLMWSFDWYADSVYSILGKSRSAIQAKAPTSDTTQSRDAGEPAVDKVWWQLESQLGSRYQSVEFLLPQKAHAALLVRANPEKGTFYKTDYRYFDQYTGTEIGGAYGWGRYADAKVAADYFKRMNYDIHVGAIGGLPGRILVFLAALIVASLPVTGFRIWWGRHKKKTASHRMQPVVEQFQSSNS